MSDWTSGFQGFQQGMALLGAGRERRKQRELEDKQLELERQRYESGKALTDAQIRALNKKLDRPTITSTDPNLEKTGVTYDEYGNEVPTFTRKPKVFDPAANMQVLDDGTRVFTDPNTGKIDVLKPDPMTRALDRLFPPAPQGPSAPTSAPAAGEGRPPLQLPSQSVQAPSVPAAAPAGQPSVRLAGIGPTGPTFKIVNPAQEPEIVERTMPDGSKQKFLRSIDPDTGKIDLSPYNLPGGQMSTEAEDKLNVTLMAMDNLPAIRQAVTKAGHYGGPVASRVTAPFEWAFGPREDRRAFQRLEAESLVPLAKGILGETGALSETEQQRYKGLLPTFSDTQTARNEKYAELKRLLTDSARNRISLMKAKGQDTGPIEKEFSNKLAIIEAVEQGAPTFRNEDEVDTAAKLGKLTPGKPVVVNGRVAVWNP